MKRTFESDKGFTLIELVTVIGIMGILAAVAMPVISMFIGAGQTEAADTEQGNVQLAVEAMIVDADSGTLSAFADDIDEFAEVQGIRATSADGTEYSLDNYLSGGRYPLSRPYDIDMNGSVTVN
jgi:prepilin-type N-terminal cleavage/methylation domain-containing protein